jgi:CheY-like chemotaxis protein
MKVLVVEDNIAVRETIADVLEFLDHDFLYAASAEEALALLQRLDAPLDLLISDISLPGLNGSNLFRRVRQRFPFCRGLLTSGLPREQLQLYGAEFMQKPFTLDQLIDSVEAVANGVATPALR